MYLRTLLGLIGAFNKALGKLMNTNASLKEIACLPLLEKTEMIETHAHLYDEQFDQDIEQVIANAKAAGVKMAYLPNCDSGTIAPMMKLVEQFPDYCKPMMGIHPCYIKDDYKNELAIAEKALNDYDYAAIGEIGLDYHWDKTFIKEQKEAFQLQIDWALAKDLAIIIHSRSSTEDCIKIVKQKQNGQLKGIFHCFGDDVDMAKQIIDLGFYLGIGGVVTFKNSGLQETLAHIDLEHLVLETDAPYLAPVPKRGKRNETSYLDYVVTKIAEIKNVSREEVIAVTSQNAAKVFKY